jgi:RimJ/RimL family protein N-acetyltransferase
VRKADVRIIGWGGLYDDPFDPGWGMEVAYSFEPAAWGQGYASELTRACTTFADDALGRRDIHAFAHRDNIGSQRVLEKAEFTVVRFVPELDRLLYRRGRPA